MPLFRQIGSTDAQALLAASGGAVGDVTLNPSDPIVTDPPTGPTSVTVPIPVSAIDPSLKTLLWAGLGLGVGWWLGKSDDGDGVERAGTVGKGGKSLLPLLVIGGLAAWYFLKPAAAATTPAGGGGAPLSTAATDRQWMLTQFHATNVNNDTIFKSAVAQMTDDEAVAMYNILQYVASGQGALPANMQTQYVTITQKYGIPGL